MDYYPTAFQSFLLAVIIILKASSLSSASMTWKTIDNEEAVCNDFSRAGYYIERSGTDSDKWLVFLESGGVCYSPETCNRRFFHPSIREEFAEDGSSSIRPEFNFTVAWNTLVQQNRSLVTRLNPLMTSMSTYISDNSSLSVIQGRDILDSNRTKNPAFYDYNHVLIPYCSSDVWVGDDNRPFDNINLTSNAQWQFLNNVYKPENSRLQFTFRGSVIFRSVINELLSELNDSSELVLAGSSAGGVGVVNHAKWVYDQFSHTTNISVISDSSWFIDFRGNIYSRFNEGMADEDSVLLVLSQSAPQCSSNDTISPCCFRLNCMLNNPDYFPVGKIPVMALTSLYDLFILGSTVSENSLPGQNEDGMEPDFGLTFLSTVAEYGGAMNTSISTSVASTVPAVSFIITECLQHVYLATSTLWDQTSVLGNISTFELSEELGPFQTLYEHTIKSEVWSSYHFSGVLPSNDNYTSSGCDPTNASTIQDAISMWKRCRYSTPSLQFRDSCYSIHCNSMCPDELNFANNTNEIASFWLVLFVAVTVVCITICSIITKVIFNIWKMLLARKQNFYLHQVSTHQGKYSDCSVPEFPACLLEEAISVACVDLKYSIDLHCRKQKDEREDNTTVTLVIDGTIPEAKDKNDTNKEVVNHKRVTKNISQLQLYKNFLPSKPPPLLEEANDELMYSQKGSLNPQIQPGCCGLGRVRKEILHGISLYFNPGELVGIMGPSGCGKTTLLDLLTGRRTSGNISGNIYVNGKPLSVVKERYAANTGYVLQLATPYYEELTVRENLTLAAHMKLPNKMTWRQKFERVEQVMDVTGLLQVQDTQVGGASGPGLSGGQKRRLVIALQLLKMPKVIFLDEPTSGLDATSSIELLSHLNRLAYSNRTVVLTIHQPRFEIFYMFHKLILLSEGKVAYHGVPQKAYGFFVEALMSKFLNRGLILPQLEEHNPADVIMDMLGKPWMREAILDHYQTSTEPDLIKLAIKQITMLERETIPQHSSNNTEIPAAQFKRTHQANWFVRFAVLEARASKSTTYVWRLYLPFVFFMYGFLLGTVYFQQTSALLIMSGFCVYSVASALFMFPVLQNYYLKVLEVYGFEKADGAGRSHDLVFQGFARFATMAIIPVVLCAAVLYLLLVNQQFWSLTVFLQLVLVAMALNQTWISLLIFLICTLPSYAFRLSPIIASIAGFTSGFFIPLTSTTWVYRWIFYVNPNYYGFSASANFLLANLRNNCSSADLECYLASGNFILKRYDFDEIEPYRNIAILLGMTIIYLFLAVFSNWLRHTNVKDKIRAFFKADTKLIDEDVLTENQELGEELEEKKAPIDISMQELLHQSEEDEVFTNPQNKEVSRRVMTGHQKIKKLSHQDSSCLLIEDQCHEVYQPERESNKRKESAQFCSIAETFFQNDEDTCLHRRHPRTILKERQQDFNYHVKVSKEVVKETTEELINNNEIRTQKQLRGFTVKLSQKVQRQPHMANVVTKVMAQMKPDASGATATAVYTPSSIAMAWREKVRARKEHMEGIIPVPVEELPNLKRRISTSSEETDEVISPVKLSGFESFKENVEVIYEQDEPTNLQP